MINVIITRPWTLPSGQSRTFALSRLAVVTSRVTTYLVPMVRLWNPSPKGVFVSSAYKLASRASTSTRGAHRSFRASATARATTHYDVLSLPRSATRSQIKARFYKLSKDLHPDLNPTKDAKERYLKVSEAYNVLGDEKRRRSYDQSLRQATSAYTSPAPSTSYPSWMQSELHRKRGATHAWERSRRAPGPGPGQGPGYYRADPWAHYQYHSRYNDYTVHGTAKRKASSANEPKAETPEQKVSNESVMWRVVQVVGVLWLAMTIGGGWSAHA
ncbi:DnaJ-domain-containing protein [Calocera cornea HHB12733]|uniref:DnaJ-domain-containing protein n=1 Tax=Calocera cornea HHB12733 TaxID=1353952 RepID=A0A165HGP5_9BASI|nr:DnaJ-domain-containing protein [Calocera cornea HHB12733]